MEVIDLGSNNLIKINAGPDIESRGSIRCRGSNNVIQVGEVKNSGNPNIDVGNNCNIDIADHVRIGNLIIYCNNNAEIKIGRYTGFNGRVQLHAQEPSSITFGEGCLVSHNVQCLTSDIHSIFDIATGRRINYARDITIGDRVWLGLESTVLKGITIGSGAVIGAHAVVTKPVPPHCVAAGNPARVLRRGVTWDQRLLDKMPTEAIPKESEWSRWNCKKEDIEGS